MARLSQALPAAWYRADGWLWALRPLELVFRAGAALRRRLYRMGWLSVFQAPKPVVVVGNIAVGGTGKTPVVIALVEALAARGLRVGVVSRGYGARRGTFPHVLDQDSRVDDCGDEALLLYRRTGCPCVVDPSRVAAVQTLLDRFDVDLVICDDGLQHYALGRDLEIVLVDALLGHGNGFCLPAGPLREPVSRLRSVDFVLYRGDGADDDTVVYEPDALVNLRSAEHRTVDTGSIGTKVHALAGIGQPDQFFRDLRKAGFELEAHVYPDHHGFCEDELRPLAGKPVIMTEKDAVKCTHLAGDDAWYLKISARLPQGLVSAVAALAEH
jgi:tetraacyldisaccharide 4'-kinase